MRVHVCMCVCVSMVLNSVSQEKKKQKNVWIIEVLFQAFVVCSLRRKKKREFGQMTTATVSQVQQAWSHQQTFDFVSGNHVNTH